jgi:phosphatidylserine/phosphatidylglycerophosphate/cardiolipin synthase-like enzyme
MQTDEMRDLLLRTLDDRRLSRNERQALADVFRRLERDEQKARLCGEAFTLAREQASDPSARALIDWLEEVVRASSAQSPGPDRAHPVEVHFSPGEDCPRRIAGLFHAARRKVDVCVFTITDNRVSEAILDAHRRGVVLRVVTDNEKADDAGSDIARLAEAGIAVRVDRSVYHMHHKFAIFDDSPLLTGSFNWTRGAAEYNEENFIVTADPRLIHPFADRFEKLWERLA